MIKNQKQAAIAKKEIANLQKILNEADRNSTDFKQQLQFNIFESQLSDLLLEIEEYGHLTSKKIESLEIKTENLQKAIISFRIASGLTQKEIADKLEIQEQQIQRYEQNDYLTASFERIIQILQALEVEVTFKKKFKRDSKIRFLIPEKNKPLLEHSIQQVHDRKQLVNW
jgi:transcriptional regulator with XRE-family HTH domain